MLPHLRQPDFLDSELHNAVLDWALANEARFVPAGLDAGTVDPAVRTALSLRDLGPVRPRIEARIAREVPAWIAALRVTPFEASAIELELVAHNDGAHFTLHSDTYNRDHVARGDRMLSAVYYFHREPKAFAGGALRLHRLGAAPGNPGTDIAPDQNSLVVFPSWAPHEVMRVECPSRAFADSRFAVNCWVYRAR
jgi:SM-20-related protein